MTNTNIISMCIYMCVCVYPTCSWTTPEVDAMQQLLCTQKAILKFLPTCQFPLLKCGVDALLSPGLSLFSTSCTYTGVTFSCRMAMSRYSGTLSEVLLFRHRCQPSVSFVRAIFLYTDQLAMLRTADSSQVDTRTWTSSPFAHHHGWWRCLQGGWRQWEWHSCNSLRPVQWSAITWTKSDQWWWLYDNDESPSATTTQIGLSVCDTGAYIIHLCSCIVSNRSSTYVFRPYVQWPNGDAIPTSCQRHEGMQGILHNDLHALPAFVASNCLNMFCCTFCYSTISKALSWHHVPLWAATAYLLVPRPYLGSHSVLKLFQLVYYQYI